MTFRQATGLAWMTGHFAWYVGNIPFFALLADVRGFGEIITLVSVLVVVPVAFIIFTGYAIGWLED